MVWKRWLAIFLSTSVLISSIPFVSFANEDDEEEEEYVQTIIQQEEFSIEEDEYEEELIFEETTEMIEEDPSVKFFEAEASKHEGFRVQDDVIDSGLQALKSIKNSSKIYLDTENTFESGKMWLWIRAKAFRMSDRISVSANGKLVQSLPVYFASGYKWNKVYLGDISLSDVTLTANSNGIVVDSYILTTNEGFVASGVTGREDSGGGGEYYPANPKVKKLKLPSMRENNGSFFAEAENGSLDGMVAMEDETASGGQFVHSPSGSQTDPYVRDTPNLGFRFPVRKSGTYAVWVRYYTPKSGQKSSWISVDGRDFYKLDTKITPQWKWAKTNTVNLAAGYHILDIRYRQSKHRIDCMIVTPDLSFTPSGLGHLPGEEVRPDLLSYEKRVIPGIYLNDALVRANTQGEKVGDTLVLPVRAFCEKLGYNFYVTDDYGVIYKDRDYLQMTEGQSNVIINGEKVAIGAPVTRQQNEFGVDFAVVAKFLGIDYTVDENNQIYCNYENNDEITWENTKHLNNGIRIELTHSMSADYYYKCAPEDYDAVSVYYRKNGEVMWEKGYDPIYLDGALRGGFSSLSEHGKYTMKMILVKDSKVTVLYQSWQNIHEEYVYPYVPDDYQGDDPVVIKRTFDNPRLPIEKEILRTVHNFIPHGDSIVLVPTYENIGCYMDYQTEGTQCAVYYREKGTEEWEEAYQLHNDKTNKQFRGSITGLTEGKTYEVKAVLSGGDNGEFISETTMWSADVPIAKEYKLSEIYNPEACEGGLQLQHLKGTPDGWIKIKGVEGDNTIAASKNIEEAVWISNCEYVILEDLVITGGYFHGVHATNNSHDIRIVNCDISNWGVPGIATIDHNDKDGMYCDYMGNSTNPNLNSGVRISDTQNITVEKCFIHDPSGRTNSWAFAHPAGPSAISLRSAGRSVIRYNDFVGSEWHRWNDPIECYYNSHITGGAARDCDIYGNVMMNGADDGTEMDGGQMNTRFYNNLVQAVLCGVSTIPMQVGPSYVFKNVFAFLGTDNEGAGAAFKSGGALSGDQNNRNFGKRARMHAFNNTIITRGNGISNYAYRKGLYEDFNVISRNNIYAVTGTHINNAGSNENVDFDYDLLVNPNGGAVKVNAGENAEKHGIQSDEVGVVDYTNGLYTAKEGGPAQDAGVDLKNFTKGYNGSKPDVGAFESGNENTAFPIRPVVVQSNRYHMMLNAGVTTGSFELSLTEGTDGQKVKLCMTDFDKTWLSVADENGNTEFELKAGEKKTIYVKADTQMLESYVVGANWNQGNSNKKGMAGVVIEQEDGHSILVTINYREKGILWAKSY